jgi:ribonuclease G
VKREIVINACFPSEARVALLEDGELAEFHLERSDHRGLAANIYKGKVTRVLPGMQAAFVDIGLEKAGFLHVSDFYDELAALGQAADVVGEEEEVENEPDLGAGEKGPADASAASPAKAQRGRGTSGKRGFRPRVPIEQQLKRNQDIIVQIAKEPMGTKGARLTSFVSLAGRYLVYTPTSNRLGVSRRIAAAEERARLRSVVKEVRPKEGGFIIRTACEGVSKREIQRDVAFLTKLWRSIVKQAEAAPSGSPLFADLDLPLRAVRDFFGSDVERLWCDDRAVYERIQEFVGRYMSRLRSRVVLYQEQAPLFDRFDIDRQLERALSRRVELKSGGHLVFDQAEALTAIDVNTGRFVGKRNQDETILKTNLEALEEVVNQLRLRNIGGIIVVDFIDMAREADRKRVSEALVQALKRDRARSAVLRISEFGLVEMTRKRSRESLEQMLTETCPHCGGSRVVKSLPTIAAEVLRSIQRRVALNSPGDMAVVKLNPEVARFLYSDGAKNLEALESRLGVKFVLRSLDALGPEEVELAPVSAAASAGGAARLRAG